LYFSIYGGKVEFSTIVGIYNNGNEWWREVIDEKRNGVEKLLSKGLTQKGGWLVL
jgi:hypothetical protein